MPRRLCPVISSLMLAACRPPLRASARASSPLRPHHRCRRYRLRCRSVPLRLAPHPAPSTRRAGRYDGADAALSVLLACPIGSPSHPCGSASDVDGGSVLAPLDYPLPAPWSSSVPPATRSLVSSDFLVVLPPCRPIASLRHSLPDHSTRGAGRGSLAPLIACLCGSFAITVRFRLRSICAGSVNVAAVVVLLAWLSYYVFVDGVMW